MNTLLLDVSEDNPFVQLLFSDISTNRRVSFCSSIHDSLLIASLVNVSFLFGRTPSSARPPLYGRAKSFATTYFSSFAALWAGHFVSFNVTKKLRDAGDSAQIQLEQIQRKIKSSTSSSPAALNIDAEAERRVAHEMDRRAAASPQRSTALWLLRPILLCPFDAVAVGLLSSHHLGAAKSTDSVLQILKSPRILVPTLAVTLFVRLALSRSGPAVAVAEKNNTSVVWNQALLDYCVVPTVAAAALRSVSGRWGDLRSTTAEAATAGAAASSVKNNRFSAILRSVPQQLSRVVRTTASLPAIIIISSVYLALAQFVLGIATCWSMGVQARLLDTGSRSAQGKFLVACEEDSSLPHHLVEAIFCRRPALESVNCALFGAPAEGQLEEELNAVCDREVLALERALFMMADSSSSSSSLLKDMRIEERRATLTAVLAHLKQREMPLVEKLGDLSVEARALMQYRARKVVPSLTEEAALSSEEQALVLAVTLQELRRTKK